MLTKTRATGEDLYREEGKAELVNGELVRMSPTGAIPDRAAGKIYSRLLRYEEEQGGGYAFSDNVAFLVDLMSADVVRFYHRDIPDTPTLFKRGEVANAEPILPGWRLPVDNLFK